MTQSGHSLPSIDALRKPPGPGQLSEESLRGGVISFEDMGPQWRNYRGENHHETDDCDCRLNGGNVF
jgi:hypothetical protein